MELRVDLSWYLNQARLLLPGEASPEATVEDHVEGTRETAGEVAGEGTSEVGGGSGG